MGLCALFKCSPRPPSHLMSPTSKKPTKSQSKYWCFTLNNYEPLDETAINRWVPSGIAHYVCFGREIGKKEGTPHLQGYVQFNAVQRATSARKFLPKAHWEVQMDTNEHAATYCKKDGDYTELGEFIKTRAGSGARTDLANAVQTMIHSEDDGLHDVALSHPTVYVKFNKGLAALYPHYKGISKRNSPVIHIRYGPTGVGKSEWAHSLAGESGYWFPRPTTSPFALGYVGQTKVVLDDFVSVVVVMLVKCTHIVMTIKGVLTNNLYSTAGYPGICY